MIKFLDLKKQYESIKREIDMAIASVINDTAFIGGKYLSKFESDFAEYCDVKYCVGVGNGTDALEIAIESLDLPKGSEVIVPANSFIASSEAVTRTGLKVVFCDVDEESYIMTAKQVEDCITSKTSAIIAVHLYGHPADMIGLRALSQKYGLKIIEDCAQAHGAEVEGKRVGSLGHVAAFSFYPGKNLGAYGDGGCVTTNDKALELKIRKIANHGRIAKYDHEFEGRNSRLDGLQAAILSVKLGHLNSWTNHRINIAEKYSSKLADCQSITLPIRKPWAKQVYHLYVIRTDDRDSLRAHLEERNIKTGVHYPVALPKLKAYEYLQQDCSDFFSLDIDENLLSLPIGEHILEEEVDEVCDCILEYFER